MLNAPHGFRLPPPPPEDCCSFSICSLPRRTVAALLREEEQDSCQQPSLEAHALESQIRTPRIGPGSRMLHAKKKFFYFSARGAPRSVRHAERVRLRAAHVDLPELRLVLRDVVLQRVQEA